MYPAMIFLGGCFFGLFLGVFIPRNMTNERYQKNFGSYEIPSVHNIFLSPTIPTLQPLSGNEISQHIPVEPVIMIDGLIAIQGKYLDALSGNNQKHQWLRSQLISMMVTQQYPNFVRKIGSDISPIMLNEEENDREWTGSITQDDDLDTYITNLLSQHTNQSNLPSNTILIQRSGDLATLKSVYLFKNAKEMRDQGYVVVSSRTRIASDEKVRQINIKKALENFGSTRIINTTGTLSFFAAVEYDPTVQKQFLYGNGIVGSDIVSVYAGGICGASTALMQGVLTNRGLRFVNRRNHSKRYHKLYDASINGIPITTPGLDATVYEGVIDFRIENIRPYPLIIVTAYEQYTGDMMKETVFSLGKEEDKGSIIYQKAFRDPVSNKQCHERLRNDEEALISCYAEIKK